MTSIDIAAIRKRARLAGVEPGVVVRTERAKLAAFDAAKQRAAALEMADLRVSSGPRLHGPIPTPPAPQRVDETGVRWVVAVAELRAAGYPNCYIFTKDASKMTEDQRGRPQKPPFHDMTPKQAEANLAELAKQSTQPLRLSEEALRQFRPPQDHDINDESSK